MQCCQEVVQQAPNIIWLLIFAAGALVASTAKREKK
jgi:hypothetical protein